MPQPMQLVGVKEALQNMRDLPAAIQRKHVRIALNAAGGILRRYAAASAPKETGLLKRSQGVKVTQKRNGQWVLIIGAKRGAKRAIKRVTKTGRTVFHNRKATQLLAGQAGARFKSPSRYGHLAHKKTPYLAIAASVAGPAAMLNAAQKLSEGVEIERRKLRGK